jgi:LPXTG-motif cell wall-anchored protein
VATPAPATSPAPAINPPQGQPSTLPRTAGETELIALFGLAAALLLGGGLFMRRRAR